MYTENELKGFDTTEVTPIRASSHEPGDRRFPADWNMVESNHIIPNEYPEHNL